MQISFDFEKYFNESHFTSYFKTLAFNSTSNQILINSLLHLLSHYYLYSTEVLNWPLHNFFLLILIIEVITVIHYYLQSNFYFLIGLNFLFTSKHLNFDFLILIVIDFKGFSDYRQNLFSHMPNYRFFIVILAFELLFY